MSHLFRTRALGALVDEYERAIGELITLLSTVSDSAFEVLRDRETADDDCRSIRTVVAHVLRSGYGYADMIRSALGVSSGRPQPKLGSRIASIQDLPGLISYTEDSLRDRWDMTDEEMAAIRIPARWGPTYDLEQLIEHAIVHVLRHRRQIERFLSEAQFRVAGA